MCAALASCVIFLTACRGEVSGTIKSSPQETAKEESPATETFTVEGWVLNPHTELGHTTIGFQTADNRLLNLIFAGMHQQFTHGMYCRVVYHRLTDDSHLPDFIRGQTRKAGIGYLMLDSVTLLPSPPYPTSYYTERFDCPGCGHHDYMTTKTNGRWGEPTKDTR